jgi:hypothetical protein
MMMMRVNEKLSFFLRRQRDKVFSASSRRRGLFFFVFCFRPLFISGKSGHMMCLFIFLSHHRSRFSLLKTSKFKSQDIFIIKKQSLLSSKNHPPRPHQVFYTHNNNTSSKTKQNIIRTTNQYYHGVEEAGANDRALVERRDDDDNEERHLTNFEKSSPVENYRPSVGPGVAKRPGFCGGLSRESAGVVPARERQDTKLGTRPRV